MDIQKNIFTMDIGELFSIESNDGLKLLMNTVQIKYSGVYICKVTVKVITVLNILNDRTMQLEKKSITLILTEHWL